MNFLKNNKAQLTLFIILGIIIVGGISFLLISLKPELNIFKQRSLSPSEVVSECIESSIKESEEEFFSQTGLSSLTSLNYKYNQQTMPFLCYSTEFYSPCIPQSPLMIEQLRKTMENKVSRDLSKCILVMKEDFEKRGYKFDYSSFNLSLMFNELDIAYDLALSVIVSKADEVIRVSSRKGSVNSVLPKLLRTSETIVNYESLLCEFNHIAWQASNRDISIQKFRAGDQTKVYIVQDRQSDREIKFAIRTCVLPAGI